MARHRTKIIDTKIIDREINFPGNWMFSFSCGDCAYPADYSRKWHEDRKLAVDDARAHRFAYRTIDAAIENEMAQAAGAHKDCDCDVCLAVYEKLGLDK